MEFCNIKCCSHLRNIRAYSGKCSWSWQEIFNFERSRYGLRATDRLTAIFCSAQKFEAAILRLLEPISRRRRFFCHSLLSAKAPERRSFPLDPCAHLARRAATGYSPVGDQDPGIASIRVAESADKCSHRELRGYLDLNCLPEFGQGPFCQYRGIPVSCGPRGLKGRTRPFVSQQWRRHLHRRDREIEY